MRIGILRVVIGTALLFGPSLAYAQRFNAIGGNKPAARGGVRRCATAGPAGCLVEFRCSRAPKPDPDRHGSDRRAVRRHQPGRYRGARDAISRGADLNGHNILGMIPMELSVDLGRNDISFLLLSMRSGDGGRNQQQTATAAAAKRQPPSTAKAGAPGAGNAGAGYRDGATAGAFAIGQAVQWRRRYSDTERRFPGLRLGSPLSRGRGLMYRNFARLTWLRLAQSAHPPHICGNIIGQGGSVP